MLKTIVTSQRGWGWGGGGVKMHGEEDQGSKTGQKSVTYYLNGPFDQVQLGYVGLIYD